MEQNRLSEPFEVYLDGHGIAYRASHFALRYWWVWLILVLLVLLLLVLSRINKKKKQSVEITEEKIIVGKDTEYKQHIIIDQKQGFPAELIVQTGASGTEAIPVTINGSIMIGRSEINDVYFDDEKMSKQHFALIVDEQNHVFMEDLNSTNGTFVNGVQIHDRTKLECGDEISAGSVEMIIWW